MPIPAVPDIIRSLEPGPLDPILLVDLEDLLSAGRL